MRAWMGRSTRASADERSRALPGDGLIDKPVGSVTQAITITGTPGDVWPWLAQMGCGRAGWYSYDWLDNGGRPSAKTIRSDLQSVAAGSVFPAAPGARDGFVLAAHRANEWLTLTWPQPDGRTPLSWTFVLERAGGDRTRLLARARIARAYRFRGLPPWISAAVVRPVHAVMQRRQLKGIAARVERADEAVAASDVLLDRFIPAFDVVERHSVRVVAPAELTLAAAREVRLSADPVVRTLVRAREWLMRARHDDTPRPPGLLAFARSIGWGLLAEEPGREVVMGAVTKPWEGNVTFHPLAPEKFAEFHEPGYVKIAWTLRADPDGPASIARSETRAVATDDESRARFRRYWRRVVPGVVLIRHAMMRQVKRDAERLAHAAT